MIVTKTYPAAKSINNVFDDFFGTLPGTWASETKVSSAPVNITETEAGYQLDFSVPGRSKEDFKINLENKLLTISYEKAGAATEEKETKSIRKEFSLSGFKRSFSVDDKVNTDGIEAKYENGTLKVFLPKKEEVKNSPKQISIQ